MKHLVRSAMAIIGVTLMSLPLAAPTQAVDTDMAISTTAIDFGDVTVGSTSQVIVTLTNTGGDPFGPINIFGGAPPTAEFNAAQNCQAMTLPAGGSCQITYSFSPGSCSVFTDASSFTVSETAQQTDGEDFIVSLTGVGVGCGTPTATPTQTPTPTSTPTLTTTPTATPTGTPPPTQTPAIFVTVIVVQQPVVVPAFIPGFGTAFQGIPGFVSGGHIIAAPFPPPAPSLQPAAPPAPVTAGVAALPKTGGGGRERGSSGEGLLAAGGALVLGAALLALRARRKATR